VESFFKLIFSLTSVIRFYSARKKYLIKEKWFAF
jgi:hypothetical protein